MTRYLLDTSIAIAVIQGAEPAFGRAEVAIADGLVVISTCSVGELYFGVHAGAQPEKERAAVAELMGAVEVIDYDEAAAREYGRLRAAMRSLGHIIPPVDTQIAATALVYDLVVASADKHFLLVPDLKVENWLLEP